MNLVGNHSLGNPCVKPNQFLISVLWIIIIVKLIFSCKSDSRIANVCPSVCQSPKPLSLSELILSTIEPIDHGAYQPSSPLTIESIDHQAYRPSSLLTIKPIDYQAYWPLSLSNLEPINYQAYWAYRPSSLSTIKPIDIWSSFTTFKPLCCMEDCVRVWTNRINRDICRECKFKYSIFLWMDFLCTNSLSHFEFAPAWKQAKNLKSCEIKRWKSWWRYRVS